MRIDPELRDARPTEESDVFESDVRIAVKEAQTGSFRINVGFNSDSGIVGSISFTENFDMLQLLTFKGWRGAGRTLSASASATSG